MKNRNEIKTNPDEASANRDAITGTPGSHPVGTAIGAAGAGAAGAAIGSVVGPVGSLAGAAIGAVVGAVAGGLAGKGVAEAVNPTAEDAYWRENFRTRPYVGPGATYDAYQAAYQLGWESPMLYAGESFDDVEDDLRDRWERENPHGEWVAVRDAVRDSYTRIAQRPRTDAGECGCADEKGLSEDQKISPNNHMGREG